jgi:ABC-type phosphate transport system permease subunit
MARPWERLFIGTARVFASMVVLVPAVIACALATAAIAGVQRRDPSGFIEGLLLQLVATLGIAGLGGVLGVTMGIGTAFLARELGAGRVGNAIGLAASGLSAFPAVVLGWFGATLILPEVFGRRTAGIVLAACIVVTLAVLPRAYALCTGVLASIPSGLREAAAAAGAVAGRVSAHVLIPSSRRELAAIYADGLARAVGEAAGVSIVFLAAARAGYPVALFTLGGSIVAHAQTMQAIDAGIAQVALVALAMAVTCKRLALRKAGGVQWAR